MIDRDGLDGDPGPRVRVRIGVPRAWGEVGATVIVEAPRRVACARCDGGGCDGCGRSGVVRLAEEPASRTFRLALPTSLGEGAIVRLARPFGEGSDVAQVHCEIRVTATPEGCTREGGPGAALVPAATTALAVIPKGSGPIVGVVLAVLALVSLWLHGC